MRKIRIPATGSGDGEKGVEQKDYCIKLLKYNLLTFMKWATGALPSGKITHTPPSVVIKEAWNNVFTTTRHFMSF